MGVRRRFTWDGAIVERDDVNGQGVVPEQRGEVEREERRKGARVRIAFWRFFDDVDSTHFSSSHQFDEVVHRVG